MLNYTQVALTWRELGYGQPRPDDVVAIIRQFHRDSLLTVLIRLNLATHGLIRPVRYRERTQHYLKDDGLDPVLLKPLSHVDQHEVRFIFFPAKEITEGHRILTIPKLRDFCEIDPRVDSIK